MNIQADYFAVIHRLSSGVRDYRQVSYSGAVKKFTGSGCQPPPASPLRQTEDLTSLAEPFNLSRSNIATMQSLTDSCPFPLETDRTSREETRINETGENSFDFYRGTKGERQPGVSVQFRC